MQDPRFVLATKQEHGACPEMVTPELVARIGAIDTIVCHTDFDGLCSAAKWLREGVEPYPGADDDARAVDTRIGTPGPVATRIDRAIRARGRDQALMGLIVRHLSTGLADASLWTEIDKAGAEMERTEAEARRLASLYQKIDTVPARAKPFATSIALVDVTGKGAAGVRYDKTALLLLGQERASCAILLDGDTLSVAAPFDSGANFLELLGLSGGMPTLVSVHADRLADLLGKLGVADSDIERLVNARR
jgi:hypothetical protein